MPTSNDAIRNATSSAQDEPCETRFHNRFAFALIGDRAKLCDAEVMTRDGVAVPVSRKFLALSSTYFNNKYLSNEKGPYRDVGTITVPINNDVFSIVLEFFYSSKSPFVNSMKDLVNTEGRNLQEDCRLLMNVAHAAAFLVVPELGKLCATAIEDVTRKFPAVACTALETMDTYRSRIYDKEDPGLLSIRETLLEVICANPVAALQVPMRESDCTTTSPRSGILELSFESLGSVVEAISKKTDFTFRSIFFWATRGKTLCANTKDYLRNPRDDLRNRGLQARALFKKLPLKDLKPEFVSSFICYTDLVDKDMTLRLSHSALKKTLADLSKLRKKLRTVRAAEQGRTNDRS